MLGNWVVKFSVCVGFWVLGAPIKNPALYSCQEVVRLLGIHLLLSREGDDGWLESSSVMYRHSCLISIQAKRVSTTERS